VIIIVEKVRFEETDSSGEGYGVNNVQYFREFRTSWEFYIGGYQPAQKWLKDRKGRVLSFDESDITKRSLWPFMRLADMERWIKPGKSGIKP